MRNILIIYTGGTIGMKRTEKGYSPVEGYLAEALSSIDDMRHKAQIALNQYVPRFHISLGRQLQVVFFLLLGQRLGKASGG